MKIGNGNKGKRCYGLAALKNLVLTMWLIL